MPDHLEQVVARNSEVHQRGDEEDPRAAVGPALEGREEQHTAPDEHHPADEVDPGVDRLPPPVVAVACVGVEDGMLPRTVDEHVGHGGHLPAPSEPTAGAALGS